MKKTFVFAAALMLVFALAGCGKITVDPSEFVNVTFEGYDTLGTATYEFDYKHFIREYEDTLKLTGAGKKASDELEDEADEMGFHDSPADYLAVYIKGELDKDADLSNGDTVTWKWDVDTDKIAEYFNCDIVLEDQEFKVKDLIEAEAFDPFDGLEVTFSGTAPNGQVNLSIYTSEKCSGVYLEADKTNGLKNGDVVTVYAKSYGSDLVSYIVENYGMLPTEESKEYTVSGLPEYIPSAADISDETMNKLKKQGEDTMKSIAADWNNTELNSATCIGNYFLTPKDPSGYNSNNNIITLVYKIDATATRTYDKTDYETDLEFYWCITWSNIMRLDDGTESLDLSKYDKCYNFIYLDVNYQDNKGKERTDSYGFYGYDNLDSLFNDHVTKKIETYDYEDNITEK